MFMLVPVDVFSVVVGLDLVVSGAVEIKSALYFLDEMVEPYVVALGALLLSRPREIRLLVIRHSGYV